MGLELSESERLTVARYRWMPGLLATCLFCAQVAAQQAGLDSGLSVDVAARVQRANGETITLEVTDGSVLRSGDGLQIRVRTQRDAYVYILAYGSSSSAVLLHPFSGDSADAFTRAGEDRLIPKNGAFLPLDDREGQELLFAVASDSPIEEISRILMRMEAYGGDVAGVNELVERQFPGALRIGFRHLDRQPLLGLNLAELPAASAAAGSIASSANSGTAAVPAVETQPTPEGEQEPFSLLNDPAYEEPDVLSAEGSKIAQLDNPSEKPLVVGSESSSADAAGEQAGGEQESTSPASRIGSWFGFGDDEPTPSASVEAESTDIVPATEQPTPEPETTVTAFALEEAAEEQAAAPIESGSDPDSESTAADAPLPMDQQTTAQAPAPEAEQGGGILGKLSSWFSSDTQSEPSEADDPAPAGEAESQAESPTANDETVVSEAMSSSAEPELTSTEADVATAAETAAETEIATAVESIEASTGDSESTLGETSASGSSDDQASESLFARLSALFGGGDQATNSELESAPDVGSADPEPTLDAAPEILVTPAEPAVVESPPVDEVSIATSEPLTLDNADDAGQANVQESGSGLLGALGSLFGGSSEVESSIEESATGAEQALAAVEPIVIETIPSAADPTTVTESPAIVESEPEPEAEEPGLFAKLGSFFSKSGSEEDADAQPKVAQGATVTMSPSEAIAVDGESEAPFQRVEGGQDRVLIVQGAGSAPAVGEPLITGTQPRPAADQDSGSVLSGAGSKISALLDDEQDQVDSKSSVAVSTAQVSEVPEGGDITITASIEPDQVRAMLESQQAGDAMNLDAILPDLDSLSGSGSSSIEPVASIDLMASDNVAAAVVMIVTPVGSGSGVILDENGHILTSWHVVRDFSSVLVVFKEYDTGGPSLESIYSASVVKQNTFSDLALLRLDELPDDMRTVKIADAASIRAGGIVHTIGHPGSGDWTHTLGKVETVNARSSWYSGRNVLHRAEVIKAKILDDPGSAGAPMLNNQMELVGMTAKGRRKKGQAIAVSLKTILNFLAPQSNQTAAVEGG